MRLRRLLRRHCPALISVITTQLFLLLLTATIILAFVVVYGPGQLALYWRRCWSSVDAVLFNIRTKLFTSDYRPSNTWWSLPLLTNANQHRQCRLTKPPVILPAGNGTAVRVRWESDCLMAQSQIEWEHWQPWEPVQNWQNDPQADLNNAHDHHKQQPPQQQYGTRRYRAVPAELLASLDQRHHVYQSAPVPLPPYAAKHEYSLIQFLSHHRNEATKHTEWQEPDLYAGQFDVPCLSGTQFACNPLRILLVGDNQYSATRFRRLLRMASAGIDSIVASEYNLPHVVVHVGDAVQHSTIRQWQTDFFDVMSDLLPHSILLYTRGNHDGSDFIAINDSDDDNNSAGAPLFHYLLPRNSQNQTLTETWQAVQLGSTRWYLLDSGVDSIAQDQWILSQFQSLQHRQASRRIVIVHIPPFIEFWDKRAWFEGGENKWGSFVRERWVPLFEQYGVDLVVSGHEHLYQRGQRNGIRYAIIGGGGGELDNERVLDWEMYNVTVCLHHFISLDFYSNGVGLWQAIDIDGEIIDSFII